MRIRSLLEPYEGRDEFLHDLRLVVGEEDHDIDHEGKVLLGIVGIAISEGSEPDDQIIEIILILNGFGVAVLVVPVIIPIALGVLVQNGLARPENILLIFVPMGVCLLLLLGCGHRIFDKLAHRALLGCATVPNGSFGWLQ